jgi:signal transduction histidine kinase
MSAMLACVPALALGAVTWPARARRRARMSHVCREVRAPLSAVHLALQRAARQGDVAPALAAALESDLRRAVLALEELRDAAGEDGGEVDLEDVLHCQVRTWREVGRPRGVEIVLAPGPRAMVVRTDGLRVAQALATLVAHAIERGSGPIRVATEALGDGIRVEVSGGGPGLPASIAVPAIIDGHR